MPKPKLPTAIEDQRSFRRRAICESLQSQLVAKIHFIHTHHRRLAGAENWGRKGSLSFLPMFQESCQFDSRDRGRCASPIYYPSHFAPKHQGPLETSLQAAKKLIQQTRDTLLCRLSKHISDIFSQLSNYLTLIIKITFWLFLLHLTVSQKLSLTAQLFNMASGWKSSHLNFILLELCFIIFQSRIYTRQAFSYNPETNRKELRSYFFQLCGSPQDIRILGKSYFCLYHILFKATEHILANTGLESRVIISASSIFSTDNCLEIAFDTILWCP